MKHGGGGGGGLQRQLIPSTETDTAMCPTWHLHGSIGETFLLHSQYPTKATGLLVKRHDKLVIPPIYNEESIRNNNTSTEEKVCLYSLNALQKGVQPIKQVNTKMLINRLGTNNSLCHRNQKHTAVK
jgi:hypothetical protein